MVKSNVPTGVKIIAVLYYIGAVAALIAAIAMFFGASVIGDAIPLLGPGLFVLGGIVLLVLAVLSFFIARGLFRKQKWSRILVIIFSVLSVLGGLSAMFTGEFFSNLVSLVIAAVIGGYLWFNKAVKAAFK